MTATEPDVEPAAAPPCEGCVPWELDSACCEDWDSLDPALACRAETLAWSTLRVLTGGQVGSCPVTVRPCLGPPCTVCNPHGTGSWMQPFLRDGNWYNLACGVDPCSCERLCEIVLPGQAAALTSVLLDGAELPLADFRIDNGHRIVREDGECWPSCQNMNAKLGEPGTLGITYVPGVTPNAAGLWAAGVLACEYAKACSGSKCRLPQAVTSISRQGVTFQMSSAMFPNNMSGIREVDAYVLSVNPNAHKVPPLVWSPDVPWAGHRYQTWQGT